MDTPAANALGLVATTPLANTAKADAGTTITASVVRAASQPETSSLDLDGCLWSIMPTHMIVPNPADYEDLLTARRRQLDRAMKKAHNELPPSNWDLEEVLVVARKDPEDTFGGPVDRLIAWIIFLEDEIDNLIIESRQCRLF